MLTLSEEQIVHVKGVIEALLFISEKPVTIDQIKKVLETVDAGELKEVIRMLKDELEDRKSGMKIVEIAGGYQMLSNSLYVSYIRTLYQTKHKEKLSKPALETLAIVAYKQPVTRADIEIIRGVNSDGVFSHLVDKELIKIVGKKDIPGKPYLYGTTRQFMEYFGLRSLSDLPKLEEFPNLQPAYEKEGMIENEVGVPAQALSMNSLEMMKQKAIAKENIAQAQTQVEPSQSSTATVEQPQAAQESEPNEP